LPETGDHLPALGRLRGFANNRGVRLAGCEEAVGVAGFEPFLRAGAYDVMMPDVKYVGGLGEMLRVAERLSEAGVAVSPHNPSGPIAHAASLHVSAAMPNFDRLEVQFDETPLFDALVDGGLPRPIDGEVDIKALGTGLGVALDLSAHGGLTTSRHYGRAPVLERLATQ
jgi:galactonate dehydratase